MNKNGHFRFWRSLPVKWGYCTVEPGWCTCSAWHLGQNFFAAQKPQLGSKCHYWSISGLWSVTSGYGVIVRQNGIRYPVVHYMSFTLVSLTKDAKSTSWHRKRPISNFFSLFTLVKICSGRFSKIELRQNVRLCWLPLLCLIKGQRILTLCCRKTQKQLVHVFVHTFLNR